MSTTSSRPSGGRPERLRDLVAQAVLAPSSHNTQPWIFAVDDDEITLIADRTRALPVNDPHDRELTISCASALLTLRVAARAMGLEPAVRILPEPADPDVLAVVRVADGPPPEPSEAALAQAIPLRRTSRAPFAGREVTPELVGALGRTARREGAWLEVVGEPQRRRALAELVAEGDRAQFADPRWRRELASWMRPRRYGDGLGAPALVRLVVRAFDVGSRTAAKDAALVQGAPVVAVLGTEGDATSDWLAAGQALQRLLLTAAAQGVQAGMLNQPCQLAELRPRLRELLGDRGWPQVVMRLGHAGGEIGGARRRDPDEVIEPRESRGVP